MELALEKENGVLILGSLYFHSQSDIRIKDETGHLQKTKSKVFVPQVNLRSFQE